MMIFRKLIENFMNNEKVLELLYCITFTNQYTLDKQPKKLAESWKLNFNQIQSQYANYKDLRSTLIQSFFFFDISMNFFYFLN